MLTEWQLLIELSLVLEPEKGLELSLEPGKSLEFESLFNALLTKYIIPSRVCRKKSEKSLRMTYSGMFF